MEILETMARSNARVWRVLIPSQVSAAISQLTDAEQVGVRQGLDSLQREGIRAADGVVARKLDSPEPLYLLRLAGAPDVRLIVHVADDAIEVEDVVRPATLRNVFHAHAS